MHSQHRKPDDGKLHDRVPEAVIADAKVALPKKAELPLPEEPMAQVAVPATIHGTSPLDTSKGPLPPKSRSDPRDKPSRRA
ncbi:hypothetical protein M8R20_01050 [Pseudomonas sp. R2.Fl]|nr:hypothetical protein [Pseudomonas sp. R2.Fl]